jgi:hypothetical protein
VFNILTNPAGRKESGNEVGLFLCSLNCFLVNLLDRSITMTGSGFPFKTKLVQVNLEV